jgi:hypothetical protein
MSPTPEQSARTKQIKRVAAHIVASILDHEEPNVPDDILDIKRSDVERALTSAWGKGRDTERIARQEAERERDEARTALSAIEYADEEIRRQYGAEFGLLDADDSPPCWNDFAVHIRDLHVKDLERMELRGLYEQSRLDHDYERQQANEWLAQLHDARAALANEEHAHGITIDQRENAQSWADSLANQIAALADHEIGEHSNLNNPWDNAQDGLQKLQRELQNLRNSRPINVPALAARLQSVREMARDAATTAMARAIEDIIYDMLPRPTGTEGLIEK